MKKIIGIVAVIAVLAGGVFGFMIWRSRSDAAEAVQAYNEAARQYNEKIAPYNEAAAGIAEANAQLQDTLDAAEAIIAQGKEAYEPDTLDDLRGEVKKAEKALEDVPVQIDPFSEMAMSDSLDRKELEALQLEAEAAAAAVEEAAEKILPRPEVPDYSDRIEKVQKARKTYEDSVQKLDNVTAPADAFVRERIRGLDHVLQTAAVTTQNDPNGLLGKEGGYLGCVYFLDDRIDQELLPEEIISEEETSEEETSGGETDSMDEGREPSGEQDEETDGAQESAGEAPDGSDGAAAAAGTAAPAAASADSVAAADPAAASTGSAAAADPAAASTDSPASTASTKAPSSVDDSSGDAAAREAGSAHTGEPAEAGETGKTSSAASAEAAPEEEGKYDVIAAGTAGGGAVEIYASVEEARKRDEYLAFFSGSVMDPGAHAVEGTCVIRASRYLEAGIQQEVIEAVRAALLRVD